MKSYLQFIIEQNTTGIISIRVRDKNYIFTLDSEETKKGLKVYLMLDDEIFQELSVEVPDSEKLDTNEFFLNPAIDSKIVKSLEQENFISKGKQTTMAGDKQTLSYHLTYTLSNESKETKNYKYITIDYKIVMTNDFETPNKYITKFKIIKDDGNWVKIDGDGYEYKILDSIKKKGWVKFQGELLVHKKAFKDGQVKKKIYEN